MEFALVSIGMIVALGLVALVANHFDRGGDEIVRGHDCSTCSEADEGNCKIHCLMEEAKARGKESESWNVECGMWNENTTAADSKDENTTAADSKDENTTAADSKDENTTAADSWDDSNLIPHSTFHIPQKTALILIPLLLLTACSTQKNTSKSRWWHSFNARYNTYFNGQQAFIDGNLAKEQGNQDNYTETLPLYPVANKQSRELGKSQYDRAIEKAEKAIKMHSIKAKPEWNSSRQKTARDREWLSRREYNPFIWRAWMLLGKSQFQKGAFDEAAATFSYMSRLYQTQPMQNGLARAWLAKCYTELDWMYDAEDVIRNMSRDSVDFRTVKDWDYTYANYYLKNGELERAVPYLRKVIKHERRSKQRAREWFIMGQIQRELGHRGEAERAFRKVVACHPPYQLEFNARIAQTEVTTRANSRQMIARLKRMAANDNNKDYLDQVYYAIGNIYLAQRDTTRAIAAYEKGNEKATRSGTEKGVLLLTLGDLYWQREKFNDAQRCYGEAIGLLDKERRDYEELSHRSKVLDELVPHTDAIHLQDSLLELSTMPEAELNKVIDRIISDLKKKEKEALRAQQEAEAEQQQRQNQAVGNRNAPAAPKAPQAQQGNGQWYFYNPLAVNQGKTTFQQQWGKRENEDNWQRMNKTVVNLGREDTEGAEDTENSENSEKPEISEDSGQDAMAADSIAADTLANDPHNREYYLAQIPFTDDQKAASHAVIMESLLKAGIIFKDKLDNLRLSEKHLTRLANDYPDYEHLDDAWYHLFLLYSRQGNREEAEQCLKRLQADHAESEWTTLLSDPYYAENARFGEHIEDSLYAATYQAFKDDRHDEIRANTRLSEERFPLGDNRPKFIFIDALSRLNEGDGDGCLEDLKTVVEKYPQSEVSGLAGMIIKGVQEGRRLHGGKFDIGDVWSRRDITLAEDSTRSDTLSSERNQEFLFLLAYYPDSLNAAWQSHHDGEGMNQSGESANQSGESANQSDVGVNPNAENQLLYEMARYNFTNYLVRNFELQIDNDNGLHRMITSGFQSYDEALQYARQLYAEKQMAERLRGCRSLIISQQNLALLGTQFSYEDYERFYEDTFLPMDVSEDELLTEPDDIEKQDVEDLPDDKAKPSEDGDDADDNDGDDDDPLLPARQPSKKVQDVDFGDDFW